MVRKAFDAQICNAQRFQHGQGFAWPLTVVELVEDDRRALGHVRAQRLYGGLCRLVDVEIQIQQRDNEMRVGYDIGLGVTGAAGGACRR